MGKKILDSKPLYLVLSALIAVALWIFVVSSDEDTSTWTVYNVPVQFVGVDVLESRNLMIVSDTPKVTLRFSATTSTYAALDKSAISVTVDVSGIAAAQEYSMGYNVAYPASVSESIQPVSQSPTNVTFTVARYTTREVELRGVFEGSAAEGYLLGNSDDFLFSPSTITVSGQEELVNQVAYALVVVTGEELTESVSGEYTFQLISNSGEELSGLDVTCSAETVYVTFPILATAEIPLHANFTYGGGASERNVSYELSVDSIIISGDKSDVDSISQIELESIDLADVLDGDSITLKIPLANELNNLSGYTEVTVTVHISGVAVKSVETTNIICSNVPEGWEAELITQALTVTVRGPEDELEAISGESVRVVADLSDINQSAGQHTLTAKVYLDSTGTEAGILGTDYRVVVSLAEQ